MNELFPSVAPTALGSAVSPVLLLTTTVLLAAPNHPRRRALAFLAGATAALLVWAVILASAARAVFESLERSAEHASAVADAAVGVALLAVAAWQLWTIRRDSSSTTRAAGVGQQAAPEAPDSRTDGPLWRLVALGAVLHGRDVSALLLFATAVQRITVADLPVAERAVATLAVIVVTTTLIWLPILFGLRMPAGVQVRVDAAGRWAGRHRRHITTMLCAGFALFLLTRAALATW